MEKIKAWWQRLVASTLIDENARLRGEIFAANDMSAALKATLRDERREHAKEASEMNKQLAHQDTRQVMTLLRERAGIDHTLPGKMALLRQQLRQELAVARYHDELLEHYAGDQSSFDDLPLEDRKRYFKMIDDQIS